VPKNLNKKGLAGWGGGEVCLFFFHAVGERPLRIIGPGESLLEAGSLALLLSKPPEFPLLLSTPLLLLLLLLLLLALLLASWELLPPPPPPPPPAAATPEPDRTGSKDTEVT
jgi:hypothetical protein